MNLNRASGAAEISLSPPRRASVKPFLLLIGAPISVLAASYAARHGAGTAIPLRTWQLALLLMWSPLPFAVPALALDVARDHALPNLAHGPTRLLRAVLLVPYLLFAAASPVRLSMAASLAGLALAALLCS